MCKIFCDKCNKEVTNVKQVFLKEPNARAESCAQLDQYVGEFCLDCLEKLKNFLKK